MKKLTLSQAFTILALAAVVAIVPACGGGGGSSGSATGSPVTPPPPPSPSVGHIHTSTADSTPFIFPVVATPGPIVIRSIKFTPTNTTDVLMYVQAQVLGSYTSGTPTTLTLMVQDSSGLTLLQTSAQIINSANANLVATCASTSAPIAFGGGPGQNLFGGNSYYTITILASSIPAGSGGFISLTTFNVVALEGVTSTDPSPNIQ